MALLNLEVAVYVGHIHTICNYRTFLTHTAIEEISCTTHLNL
jgi:hypothetical protein